MAMIMTTVINVNKRTDYCNIGDFKNTGTRPLHLIHTISSVSGKI